MKNNVAETGIEVIEIDMEEYETAENRIKVREACTLHYNQLATTKASIMILFSHQIELSNRLH